MKKFILTFIALSLVLSIALITIALILSFKVIRPTTAAIDKGLASYMNSHIVRIPEGIPRPLNDFSYTSYSWEMETTEKEVVGVNFRYTTAYLKNQDTIEATLDLPEKGDPSIFNKVLPAVISDEQSLKSAQDPLKASLEPNEKAGYRELKLSLLPSTSQTVKITWIFDKNSLPDELKNFYQKLYKFPTPVLKTLYSLHGFIFKLLGA